MTKKSLMLFSGRAHPDLAEQVAKQLDVTITPQSVYSFANGEIFVRFEESVRGSDAFVLQSHSAPINDQIMEQLIMVDALKRASAKRISVVMPFWGYSRQDKKHRGREPISARLIADMFKVAGADRIMTVDLHTAQIQGFFDGPVDHLFALPVLAEHVKRTYADHDLTVVSPDSGRVRLAERWAEVLGGTPVAFIHKTRDPDHPNEARANRVVGETYGRLCVVIDDMIGRGATGTDEEYNTLFDYVLRHNSLVNVNRAPADELCAVLGLTESEAGAIISYRTANGKIADFEALKKVKGLDPDRLEAARPAIFY
jgi:ribose-phosphate pyrophosphokinase